MGSIRERVHEAVVAFHEVFRNPNLRKLQLAWAASVTGQYAYGIAIAIYAYRQGGVAAVGLVGVIRLVPAAIVAPFAAVLGDRLPRERVMLTSDLIRAAAIGGAAAVAFAGGPPAAVYALAVVSSMAATLFHPAEAALMPSLATSPGELTAANVSSSTIESAGSFVGPAFGGLLIAATNAGTVFAITAVTFLWSAFLIARLRPAHVDAPPEPREKSARGSMRKEALVGFRTIAVEPTLRLIVFLYAAQTVVAGAVGVLVVVSALDLLDIGNSGVGYLNSASGIGGLLGAVAALVLVGRKRLASDFGLGIVLWGFPFILLGLFPNAIVALLMLGIMGVGNTIVDVAALTLLQRSVPDEVLARVFGVMESLLVGTLGLGAVLAPLLVAAFGIRVSLIVTGAVLPLLAALLWRKLTAIDAPAPERELELLRGVPLLAPLPVSTLEHLAHNLIPVTVAAGADVFREGDRGDRFYIVDAGEVEVLVGSEAKAEGPGGSFGEIALLRDVPRTATVRARTDVRLLAIERDEFISSVTGHPSSAEAADAVIGARLASLRTGIAAV